LRPSQNSGSTRHQEPEQEEDDGEHDRRQELHAHPVGAAQATGVAGLLELRVDPGDHPGPLTAARSGPRQPLDGGFDDPIEERLLELHLLQRLGLDDELAEALLDGVLPGPRRDAICDQQHGCAGDDGDEELRCDRHLARP